MTQLAVQTALIAAGSLAPDAGGTGPQTRLARRYLAVEGRRALRENAGILTGWPGLPRWPTPIVSRAAIR